MRAGAFPIADAPGVCQWSGANTLGGSAHVRAGSVCSRVCAHHAQHGKSGGGVWLVELAALAARAVRHVAIAGCAGWW